MVVRLASHRVRLASHLLKNELGLAAHLPIGLEKGLQLIEVTPEPGEFLRQVAAVRKQRDFAEHALVIQFQFEARLAKPLQQLLPVIARHLRRPSRNQTGMGRQAADPLQQIHEKHRSLPRAHCDKVPQGGIQGSKHLLTDPLHRGSLVEVSLGIGDGHEGRIRGA